MLADQFGDDVDGKRTRSREKLSMDAMDSQGCLLVGRRAGKETRASGEVTREAKMAASFHL